MLERIERPHSPYLAWPWHWSGLLLQAAAALVHVADLDPQLRDSSVCLAVFKPTKHQD